MQASATGTSACFSASCWTELPANEDIAVMWHILFLLVGLLEWMFCLMISIYIWKKKELTSSPLFSSNSDDKRYYFFTARSIFFTWEEKAVRNKSYILLIRPQPWDSCINYFYLNLQCVWGITAMSFFKTDISILKVLRPYLLAWQTAILNTCFVEV